MGAFAYFYSQQYNLVKLSQDKKPTNEEVIEIMQKEFWTETDNKRLELFFWENPFYKELEQSNSQ